MAWERRGRVLLSPALSRMGVVAGMSTRALGSMGGSGTPPEAAERDRRALAERLGFGEVVRVKQVHGDRVLRAEGPFPAPWPEADGLWTDRPGVLLGVVAADCVPVLVADARGRIGAAHAGWEGTSRRIAARLVEELSAAGAEPGSMTASLGPSIGPCCYAVGSERAAVVRERLGPGADGGIVEQGGRTVFDLWAANAAQLRAAGVGAVEVAGACTRCGGLDLFSRRGGDAGLLGMAFIGAEGLAR